MFDLLIRNARLVDGTGAPERRADLGVKDGRIAAIGDLEGPAAKTIDAEGLVLAPGFVDCHTHYDAQVFWDPTISPSSYHGVTTVMAGNCGFSIAPLNKDAAPYLLRMLARVEGMPETSLQTGVPWDWESFGEYLGKLEGRVGLNMGFMCGHSALRRVVMGERAVGEKATPEELEKMKSLLAASLSEGAMGFSSTISNTHNDGEGQPVPSRHASREELLALARVCRDHPGTILELLPGVDAFSGDQMELMTQMSLAAERSLNWNALAVSATNAEFIDHQISASDYARKAGAEVIGLVMASSPTVRVNFHSGFFLDSFGGWEELFKMPIEARKAYLRDPARRRELDQNAKAKNPAGLRRFTNWEEYVVGDSRDKSLNGRTVGEIAAQQGKDPFDAMLDISLADDLKTVFLAPTSKDDDAVRARRAKLWRDERTVVGASDAGAHLDMIDAFAFSSHLLASSRDHDLLSLEEAVHQITQKPARLMGLKDRGVLKEGWRADLVLFDPEKVGVGATYARHDLPGDEMRLYADASGVKHVFVNGTQIIENGAHTGALPGTVLRSGRDTETRRPADRALAAE